MSKERLIGELLLTAAPLGNDFLKELIEQAHLFNNESGPAWKAVLQRTRKSGLPDKPKLSLFTVIAATEQGEIAETETRTLFRDFAYRDNYFDNWLPDMQPKSDPCVITTLGLKKYWLFSEAACSLPNVEQTSDIAALGRSLIANGYTMTLSQVEDMVERTKRGDATGMRTTDSLGNFFFVETADENDPVSVGDVYRFGSGWRAKVRRLARDIRWRADNRLLVRNLDASKL